MLFRERSAVLAVTENTSHRFGSSWAEDRFEEWKRLRGAWDERARNYRCPELEVRHITRSGADAGVVRGPADPPHWANYSMNL